MMRCVVDETEVHQRREDRSVHARPLAVVVVVDHVAVLPALDDGESGPERGLVKRRAHLAHAAAHALDGAAADDDQADLIAVGLADGTEVAIEGELLAGSHDDAVEVGRRAGDIVLALVGGAIEPRGCLGDQFGDAEVDGRRAGVSQRHDVLDDQRHGVVVGVDLGHEPLQRRFHIQLAAVDMGRHQHQLARVVVEIVAGIDRLAVDLRAELVQPVADGVLVYQKTMRRVAVITHHLLDANPAGQLILRQRDAAQVEVVQRLLEVECHRRDEGALQAGGDLRIVVGRRVALVGQ